MFDNVERLNDLSVGKETLREADRIIAVSNATKQYVLSLGAKPDKIKVIHNGVDLSHFRHLPGKREEMRTKFRMPKERGCGLNGEETCLQERHRHID